MKFIAWVILIMALALGSTHAATPALSRNDSLLIEIREELHGLRVTEQRQNASYRLAAGFWALSGTSIIVAALTQEPIFYVPAAAFGVLGWTSIAAGWDGRAFVRWTKEI